MPFGQMVCPCGHTCKSLAAAMQVAEVAMQFHAQFLNNSSSRWESICENWQLQAELVDTVSPIYRSDFQRYDGLHHLRSAYATRMAPLPWQM